MMQIEAIRYGSRKRIKRKKPLPLNRISKLSGPVKPESSEKVSSIKRLAYRLLVALLGVGTVAGGTGYITIGNRANNERMNQIERRLAAIDDTLYSQVSFNTIIEAVSKGVNPTIHLTNPSDEISVGVIIKFPDGKKRILTAAHIAEREKGKTFSKNELFTVKYNNLDYKARVLFLPDGRPVYEPKFDLVLLEFIDEDKLPNNMDSIEIKQFRDLNINPLNKGEPVFIVGYPFNMKKSVSIGFISETDQDIKGVTYIMHTAPTSPGNSGGPVFTIKDAKSEFIGIVKGYIKEGQCLSLAIAINKIKNFFDKYGL